VLNHLNVVFTVVLPMSDPRLELHTPSYHVGLNFPTPRQVHHAWLKSRSCLVEVAEVNENKKVESEAYNASKAGDVEPDSVANCGRRPLTANHNSISSCRPLTAAVHVSINSK